MESRQRGSFIEQIGGARTETCRRLGAMASCSAPRNFDPAPPGGSIYFAAVSLPHPHCVAPNRLLRLEAEAIEVDHALVTLDVRFNRQDMNSRGCVRTQELTQLRLSCRVTGTCAVADPDSRHDANWPPPISAVLWQKLPRSLPREDWRWCATSRRTSVGSLADSWEDSEQANRDRGRPRSLAPPTPPYMRVRIRRFGGLS